MKTLLVKHIFEILIIIFLVFGVLELLNIFVLSKGVLSLLGTASFAWVYFWFKNQNRKTGLDLTDVEPMSPLNPLRGGGSTPRRR